MAESRKDNSGKITVPKPEEHEASHYEEAWQTNLSAKKRYMLAKYESRKSGPRIDSAVALNGMSAVRSLDFPWDKPVN